MVTGIAAPGSSALDNPGTEQIQSHHEQRTPGSPPSFRLHGYFSLPLSSAHHGIGAADRGAQDDGTALQE